MAKRCRPPTVDGVSTFENKENSVVIHSSSGNAPSPISSPVHRRASNSLLAKEAGLELNARGGVIVDDTLKTSDPSIYAVVI